MGRRNLLIIAAGLAGAFLLAAACPSFAGPVGYWSFNGNTNDLSGNGNNGSSTALTYSSDVPAKISALVTQSASFNGTNSVFTVPVPTTSSPLYLNSTETITMWMKALNTSQSGQYRRSFSTASGTGVEFQEDGTANTMSVRVDTVGSTNQLTGVGAAYDGNWHFIAVVLNNGNEMTYFDGALVNNAGYNVNGGFGSTNPVTFGNSDQEPSDWYTGLLSNAALYNTPLSSAQISSLYNGASPASVPEPGCVAIIGAAAFSLLLRRRREV